MSTIPIGSTDSARRAQAVIIVDRATGEPASAGGGAGTSDTTEATQLLVKTAVETTATNSTAALTKLDTINTNLTTTVTELPPRTTGGANGPVTHYAVNKADTGADTIVAADTDEAWQMSACALYISGATTLTFASGGVDYVKPVAVAGDLILDPNENGWNKGGINTAFTLSSTNAVQITGIVELQKKV